jgi:hypothetical protein
MVGNDVVDLRDADARPESFRARFDARVFDADERRAIARDPEPLARRWAHWAAKEAAFKLARQVDPGFVFTPGRLIAEFEAPERGVTGSGERWCKGWLAMPRALPTGERMLALRSFETDTRVHVVAAPSDTDWGAVDVGIEEIDPGTADASAAVRSLAVGAIARGLGIDAARLAIGRRERIPTVELDGVRTALSISLSHHGAWVAYAMRLPIEAARSSDTASSWSGRARPAAGGARSA